TGSIGSGLYYRTQLASTGSVRSALPAAGATGATNLASNGGQGAAPRARAGGKVVRAGGAAALTCGAAAGSCPSDSLIEDLVGYGSATDYEGAGPAPALTSTTPAPRHASGLG